jgi:membrane associated rhomboid family serine protease
MLPLWDTEKHRHTPWITILILIACGLTFALMLHRATQGEAAFEAWVLKHALVPSRFLAQWQDPAQWLTVLSSMFLHGGPAHLLGNCWFLWVFGNNVEDRFGRLGFLLFYPLCGAAGALAQVAAEPNLNAPMIGASGAISGVLGAYLVFFPRAWVVTLVPWVVPIVPVPALVFLVLWFLGQAYLGVGSLLAGASAEGGVAWWAHAGGFVAGAVLALLWPRSAKG